ncbi:MAG: RHS repeat protein, partial [Deltaproteobacteria bacterium]|nr:RHS repeat protein [Deltaproteobacteria bacterium]
YDALNRRVEGRDPLGNATLTGYNAIGSRTVITDANGAVTRFVYDAANRLTTIDYPPSTGSGQAQSDVTFTYNKAGHHLTMNDGVGMTNYQYDDLYRLTQVTQPSAAGGPPSVVGYGYDAVGNQTHLIYPNNQVVTYTYGSGNRLDTVTDWKNGQFGYNYDDANRLTALTLPNGVSSAYSYDDAGRL